jgi:hypothetical protein
VVSEDVGDCAAADGGLPVDRVLGQCAVVNAHSLWSAVESFLDEPEVRGVRSRSCGEHRRDPVRAGSSARLERGIPIRAASSRRTGSLSSLALFEVGRMTERYRGRNVGLTSRSNPERPSSGVCVSDFASSTRHIYRGSNCEWFRASWHHPQEFRAVLTDGDVLASNTRTRSAQRADETTNEQETTAMT